MTSIAGSIRGILKQTWNSPTIMTWGSLGARISYNVVVMLLVLSRFSAEEAAVWFLLSVIASLQLLADFGFASTFSRMIAYALGGASGSALKGRLDGSQLATEQPRANWHTVEQIIGTMQPVYTRLAALTLVVLGLLGTWALVKPISELSHPGAGWMAWAIVLAVTVLMLWGNRYNAYLQGINEIAAIRRWDALTGLGSALTCAVVLINGGRLVELVTASQFWIIIFLLGARRLSHKRDFGALARRAGRKVEIFHAVWSSAWRIGLGAILTFGVIQTTAVVYAQLAPAAEVASYLFALRLIQITSQISQAPFYTKLPTLARLRAEGKLSEQIEMAQRGMRRSYWVYAAVFVACGALTPLILEIIGSRTDFVTPLFWGILGMAIFAERYGAMHLNLYLTTNHVILHTVAAVHAVILIAFTIGLYGMLKVYAFPVAMLMSYLCFYSWYSARSSYQAFRLRFWEFERATMLGPLIIVLSYPLVAAVLSEVVGTQWR